MNWHVSSKRENPWTNRSAGVPRPYFKFCVAVFRYPGKEKVEMPGVGAKGHHSTQRKEKVDG